MPRVTRVGPDGPSIRFADINGPVSRIEALTVQCPACQMPPGRMCVYVKDQSRGEYVRGHWTQVVTHRQGAVCVKCHNERNAAVRARRLAWWKSENADPRTSPRRGVREALAAMRAWDVAEHQALRAWWREHGHLFADAAAPRPDGTPRGKSYTAIDAEREIDAFMEEP